MSDSTNNSTTQNSNGGSLQRRLRAPTLTFTHSDSNDPHKQDNDIPKPEKGASSRGRLSPRSSISGPSKPLVSHGGSGGSQDDPPSPSSPSRLTVERRPSCDGSRTSTEYFDRPSPPGSGRNGPNNGRRSPQGIYVEDRSEHRRGSSTSIAKNDE